jgi:D-tyrosyl-tRNA(Tyr) deacylase
MKALIQRVSSASVEVGSEVVGEIQSGLLVFLGVEKDDSEALVKKMSDKVCHYRVFSDENGKMNKSLKDISGELLVVSQFTLAANTNKGRRPSFEGGAHPEEAKRFYEAFVRECKELGVRVQTGRFAADMNVSLVNQGPVTFLLEVH